MKKSPIEELLEAVDHLDLAAVMELVAPDSGFLTADGRRAHGREAVRELMADFLASIRSTTHRITAQWHQDDVWIAEVEATYELTDWLKLNAVPRAFVLRQGPRGFAAVHVYGAHERPLAEHRTGEEGLRVGDRWIPPL